MVEEGKQQSHIQSDAQRGRVVKRQPTEQMEVVSHALVQKVNMQHVGARLKVRSPGQQRLEQPTMSQVEARVQTLMGSVWKIGVSGHCSCSVLWLSLL